MSDDNLEANLKGEWSSDSLGQFGSDPNKKTPFKILIFPDLFPSHQVNRLRDDVNSCLRLKPKDNDLYKFKQSKDMKSEVKKVTPLLNNLIDVMLGPVRKHLEQATGKRLSSTNFDITASRYDVGNYLLCHNDDIKDDSQRNGRSLAFVYYLNSRTWTKEDGGALVIYDSDSNGEPVTINNSILPKPNTLIVFETNSTSWHSVQEVYCKDDFRLSINGWFHRDGLSISKEPEKEIELCPYNLFRPKVLDERLEKFFKECFNQDYLMDQTCTTIRKKFKRKSEINLVNFMVQSKFEEISKALKEAAKKESDLILVGPYNKRNYKTFKVEKLPQICIDLYDAFKSELFFLLLSRLTGLDLQPPSLKQDTGSKESKASDGEEGDDSDSSDEDEEENEDEEEEEDNDDEEEDDDDDDEGDESEECDDKDGGQRDDEKVKKDSLQSAGQGGESILKIIKSKADNANKDDSNQKVICGDVGSSKGSIEPTTSKVSADAMKGSSRKRKRISDPLARLEFRHLETGSYTLIHDYGFELGEKSALDVILHFNHDFKVNFEDGGYISYIDGGAEDDLHDMDCELLTVEPKSNSLSLVYRCDEGTCRFLKHINKSHKSNYQDLYCVYYERPDDLPNLGQNKKSLAPN